MAIARNPSTVVDCPDPHVLARFYAELLGWRIDEQDDWVDVRSERGECISFQQVEDYLAPTWPTQEHPQQMHIDVVVDDLDEAEQAVVAIGATRHATQPGTTFRVMLDPAGHPFRLCLN